MVNLKNDKGEYFPRVLNIEEFSANNSILLLLLLF